MINEIDNIHYGCHMAELMDGSGECGKFIWGDIDQRERDVVEQWLTLYNVDAGDVVELIDGMTHFCYSDWIHVRDICQTIAEKVPVQQ